MTRSDTHPSVLLVLAGSMAANAFALGMTAWLAGTGTSWEHTGFGIYVLVGAYAASDMLSRSMHIRRRIIHGLLLAILLFIFAWLGRESELSWWAMLGIPGGFLVGSGFVIARKAVHGLSGSSASSP